MIKCCFLTNCAWCCVKGTFFLTEIALEEHTCKRKAHRKSGAPCVVVLLLSLSRQGFDGQGIVCTIGFFCEPPRRCRLWRGSQPCGGGPQPPACRKCGFELLARRVRFSRLPNTTLSVSRFNHDGSRRRWTIEANFRYRKSEQCACVKRQTHSCLAKSLSPYRCRADEVTPH